MSTPYYVKALWDPEADVWTSETNIPGLVVETASLAEFEDLVRALAPELLADNADLHGVTVPYRFTAEGSLELKVA